MNDNFIKNPIEVIEAYTMPLCRKNYKSKKKEYKCISPNNYNYMYNDGIYNFPFSLLSDYVRDDLLVQELQSKNRYSVCNSRNYKIASMFDDSKLVIGSIKDDNSTKMHSWIITKYFGDEMVIDYSKNIILNKMNYYELLSADDMIIFNSDEYLKFLSFLEKNNYIFSFNCSNINDDKDKLLKFFINK